MSRSYNHFHLFNNCVLNIRVCSSVDIPATQMSQLSLSAKEEIANYIMNV